MSQYRDGLRVATNAFEAAAWHKTVKVACACQHVARFDAHGLWWLFYKRGWDDSFRNMRPRFYCTRCLIQTRQKVRPKVIEAVQDKATMTLAMPDPNEWKRAISRFRG